LVFPQLALKLEAGDDQIYGVECCIGQCSASGPSDAVAQGLEGKPLTGRILTLFVGLQGFGLVVEFKCVLE